MNRRTAILVGSLIAVLATVELIVLSGLLAAAQSDRRARYDRAIAEQRADAGRIFSGHATGAERRLPVHTTMCVRGVETFATTVRSLHRDLLTADRRLDVDGFRALSNHAVQAQRYVEQSNAGPALPQRMGRERAAGSGAPDEPPTWTAIAPPRVECEDDLAYARFRLDVTPEPAIAPP